MTPAIGNLICDTNEFRLPTAIPYTVALLRILMRMLAAGGCDDKGTGPEGVIMASVTPNTGEEPEDVGVGSEESPVSM